MFVFDTVSLHVRTMNNDYPWYNIYRPSFRNQNINLFKLIILDIPIHTVT